MHVYQFYIAPEAITGEWVELSGSEWHHCSRVLRKQTGERLNLFEGRGRHYQAEIVAAGQTAARCRIIDTRVEKPCLPTIRLGVGLIRQAALDSLVTELSVLGASDFFPIVTRHAVKHGFNRQRCQKLALEAVKQCGAAWLPVIHERVSLEDWLAGTAGFPNRWLLDMEAGESFGAALAGGCPADPIALLFGPEGGLAEDEIQLAMQNGFQPLRLSRRRLRTETAVGVALAALHVSFQERGE